MALGMMLMKIVTNCGDEDPTPIVGYEYKEYENCDNAAQKQVFRLYLVMRMANCTSKFNLLAKWTTVTTTTNVDVSSLPTFADCASCGTVPTPPTPPSPQPLLLFQVLFSSN